MTAAEIRRIAGQLSNSTWCRYWLNVEDARGGESVIYAIQCRDYFGQPEPIYGIEKLGFQRIYHGFGPYFYTIQRTNDDGTPYKSQL
jgi:hypothetical protein